MTTMLLLLGSLSFFGCAASTDSSALAPDLSQEAFLAAMQSEQPPLVLDVRTQAEYDAGHVAGAILVPHDQLKARLPELAWEKEQPIVLYCRSGRRTEIALAILREAGFRSLSHLRGDWLAWTAAGRPIEVATPAADRTD